MANNCQPRNNSRNRNRNNSQSSQNLSRPESPWEPSDYLSRSENPWRPSRCGTQRRPFQNQSRVETQQRTTQNQPKNESRDWRSTGNLSSRKSCSSEINILVLGETGVGKSTFINAFANYLSHETLDDASYDKLLCLIPTKFNVTSNNYQSKTVSFGFDSNESSATLMSSQTQSCRSYLIHKENRTVRLIDTPGIGDTRGVEQDRKNFENILAFVSHYPILHGILILLQPNNSRLSVTFRFCVQELLCHLHKSASENIVFLFTNTRGTFYRPGDTITPLKALLDEVKMRDASVDIPLDKGTIYCIDNESFRYLVAAQNGINFTRKDKEDYAMSWRRSAHECRLMVDRIGRTRPHETSDTISVNEARRMIVALSKPIGDITQSIQFNLDLLRDQNEKIKIAGDEVDLLKRYMYVPIVDLEPHFFDKPRTVCTSSSCIQVLTVNEISKIDYVQICHSPCYLKNVTPELVNNSELSRCSAMENTTGKCKKCADKCGWEKHMHIYYENKQVKKSKIDSQIRNEIDTKEKRTVFLKKLACQLEERKQQLEKEQKTITNISAHFAHFLKKNAITPYNDAVKDYLNHLIENEKTKCEQGVKCKGVLESLQKMSQAYEAEVLLIEDSISSTQATNTSYLNSPNEMNRFVKELIALKLSGPIIEKMFKEFQKSKQREYANFRETSHYV